MEDGYVERCPECKKYKVCKIKDGEFIYRWKQLSEEQNRSLESRTLIKDLLCDKCSIKRPRKSSVSSK